MKIKTVWIFIFAFLFTACNNKEVNSNLIFNPGFEQPLLTGIQTKWSQTVHAGETAYEFSVDSKQAYAGNNSYKIHQFKTQTFGQLGQTIEIKKGEKKAFEFSAMIRTKGIEKGSGTSLVINLLAPDDFIIKQYKSEQLIGDNEWQKIILKGEIHQATNRLSLGIMLQSKGVVWIDDVTLIAN